MTSHACRYAALTICGSLSANTALIAATAVALSDFLVNHLATSRSRWTMHLCHAAPGKT